MTTDYGTHPKECIGVWMAYYQDGSAWEVFRTEVEALRYALPMMMAVEFRPFHDASAQR